MLLCTAEKSQKVFRNVSEKKKITIHAKVIHWLYQRSVFWKNIFGRPQRSISFPMKAFLHLCIFGNTFYPISFRLSLFFCIVKNFQKPAKIAFHYYIFRREKGKFVIVVRKKDNWTNFPNDCEWLSQLKTFPLWVSIRFDCHKIF